jgi:histidine ammonia-lyase
LLNSTACAIDAMHAPSDIYGEDVGKLSNDPVLIDVLAELRTALSGYTSDTSITQAPVSFRVSPQILTHLERTISRFTSDVERALGAVSDSPAFVGGGFTPTGGFHEIELAAGLDACASALIRAAELSGQRVHRLLDGRFSGLPDQLTPDPGPRAGLIVVHKRVVGAINELRRLSTPASLGVVDTSLGQEDAMTFAFDAAEKLRWVESLVRDVVACELLVVRQAWALREEPVPAGLRQAAQQIIEAVDPVDEDRPLEPDVARLVGMLEHGELA